MLVPRLLVDLWPGRGQCQVTFLAVVELGPHMSAAWQIWCKQWRHHQMNTRPHQMQRARSLLLPAECQIALLCMQSWPNSYEACRWCQGGSGRLQSIMHPAPASSRQQDEHAWLPGTPSASPRYALQALSTTTSPLSPLLLPSRSMLPLMRTKESRCSRHSTHRPSNQAHTQGGTDCAKLVPN